MIQVFSTLLMHITVNNIFKKLFKTTDSISIILNPITSFFHQTRIAEKITKKKQNRDRGQNVSENMYITTLSSTHMSCDDILRRTEEAVQGGPYGQSLNYQQSAEQEVIQG